MQEKSKVQLAAALAATLGFVISGTANAANRGHSQLNVNDRHSPSYSTSRDGDNSQILLASKDKGGSRKGKEGSCKGKQGSCKGKQGSCKGKEGSCKGKQGSCKGKDNSNNQSPSK